MNKRRFALKLALPAVVGCLVAATASAQDLGGTLRKALNNRTSGLFNMVLKSVTEVSAGQVAQGAQGPQGAEGKVVLYSTAWCGYCKRELAYMRQKNIPFIERNIESNPAYREEYRRLGGNGGVPFTVFGTRTLQGFTESSFDSYYAEFQRAQVGAVPGAQDADKTLDAAAGSGGPQAGDTLIGKITGIPVYSQPAKQSTRLTTLANTDEVIFMGEERDGFYRVTSAHGEGWVDKLLVRKN